MNPTVTNKDEPEPDIFTETSVSAVLEANLMPDEDSIIEYAKAVMKSLKDNEEKIDEIIRAKMIKWKLEDISVLDRTIMKISVSEMLYHDIAPAVSINEAVEIAKKYSGEQASKFINGVLDRIAKNTHNQN